MSDELHSAETELDEHGAIKRIQRYCEFGDNRAYILWLVARRKHNEELSNSEEVIHRRVLTDADEIEPNVRDLYAIAGRHPYTFRLYLTVNARDTETAMLEFHQELVNTVQAFVTGDDSQQVRAERLDSEWKSVLHQPRSKAETRFQWDLDDVTKDECEQFIESIPGEYTVRQTIPTPNGFHVISEPFNYPDWDAPIEYDELDTDGQLFVADIHPDG
jgi:hypothetical protein